MKISIAMATYNGQKYLQEQLDSFATQTRQPDELVVCDDGSSDATINLLRQFAIVAPFEVRVYENETNLGFTKNFEKAMSLCSGDIIFLSDQDDVWFENKIAEAECTLLRNPRKMVVTNDQVVTDKKLRNSMVTELGNTRRLGYPDSWYAPGCCTAFRKDWLRIINPIPSFINGHDAWLNGLADLLYLRVVIEQPLQFYRRYGDNVSSAETSDNKRVSRFKLLKIYGLRDARSGWEREIKNLGEYKRRLEERQCQLADLVENDELRLAYISLDKKMRALRRRIDLLSSPRRLRWPSLFFFWSSGGYEQFAGWKSAAKDLLRP